MNKKEQDDVIGQNQEIKKIKQTKKFNEKIVGLDIDKIEYQEIVLSYSNAPGENYFKQDFYD